MNIFTFLIALMVFGRAISMDSPNRKSYHPVGATDIMTNAQGQDESEVFARIFYPATLTVAQSISSIPWIAKKEYIDGTAEYKGTPALLLDVFLRKKRVDASWHAPIAVPEDKRGFPVIVLSHGLAGARFFYSKICVPLAREGFIVVSIEHRDGSACWTYKLKRNGMGNLEEEPLKMHKLGRNEDEQALRKKQLSIRVNEILNLLDVLDSLNNGEIDDGRGWTIFSDPKFQWSQFKGKMNIDQFTAFGHSFGGATALAALSQSTKLKAAVALDAWMLPIELERYDQLTKPILFINSGGEFQTADDLAIMRKIGGNPSQNTILTLRGTEHGSFSDFAVLLPQTVTQLAGIIGKADPVRCLKAAIELSHSYILMKTEGFEENFKYAMERYDDLFVR